MSDSIKVDVAKLLAELTYGDIDDIERHSGERFGQITRGWFSEDGSLSSKAAQALIWKWEQKHGDQTFTVADAAALKPGTDVVMDLSGFVDDPKELDPSLMESSGGL